MGDNGKFPAAEVVYTDDNEYYRAKEIIDEAHPLIVKNITPVLFVRCYLER